MKDAIILREVEERDLSIFFEQQLDPDANHMAAFTAREPADRDAFMAHWHRILADESIAIKTILCAEAVAGHVLSFTQFGEPEVSYWIGKKFWGRGVATAALSMFLETVNDRPLYARVAKDNIGSMRVLQKCGFKVCGEDKGFAYARRREVEEYILRLEQDSSGHVSRESIPKK